MEGNQPRRRPRSAAGQTPPLIAADLTHLTATARLGADLLDCCTAVDVRALVTDAILPALRCHLTLPLQEVVLSATRTHLSTHLAGHAPGTGGTWSGRTEADLATALAGAWHASTPTGGLNEVIAAVTATGLDGELIASEIIIRETNRHLGLVNKEISKLLPTLPDTNPADLVGYGWRGLRVALRQFDPALGFSFATFACPKINGAIRDGIRSEHYLPKRLTTFSRRVTAAEEALTTTLSRTPSFQEIADYLSETSEAMHLAARIGPAASLEELADPWGDRHTEPTCLVDQSDVSEAAIAAVRDADIADALTTLPDDAAALLRMLFYQDSTLTAAAAHLGVDVRTARDLRDRAFTTLRDTLGHLVAA